MTSKQSRRNFLLTGTAIVASAAVAPLDAFAQSSLSGRNPLAIPPIAHGTVTNGVRVFDLNLQDGSKRFSTGLDTPTRGINGDYLGPVLRMRSGETVRFQVSNTLSETTTLHWHGMNLPAKADGGPHQPIRPGTTWTPEFSVRESAATLWYHAHQMGATARHVWSGLAGMIQVEDDLSDHLDLPKTYGVDDIPLILQDRRFDADGSMPYRKSMHDEMAGMIGNIPVINGTVRPAFAVTTQHLRLRLLNGSNASIYNLTFQDGRPFSQIASDGGFLETPVTMRMLRLSPGERAEIIVEFQPEDSVMLRSIAAGPGGMGEGMMGGMMGGMMNAAQSPEFNLIHFTAKGPLQPSVALPKRLASLPQISAKDARRTRKFLLEMPSMGVMNMLGLGGGYTINGKSMDMARIDEIVPVGETEIWEIQNAGPMTHPFHIHNTQFRILDRNGRAPLPGDMGLKDTVVVPPNESLRLLVRFDHYTDPDRPYMYHCHILEHEDAGMMGQFTVV